VDPVHAAFFAVNSLSSVADALVRETIQNSLDAGLNGDVRVRFSLQSVTCTDEIWGRYFAGLMPHLSAVDDDNISVPEKPETLPLLVIEDFGTRGLQGDPHQDDDYEVDGLPRNDFYYFWRNVGRSNKSEDERGRWGLGKIVFPIASNISSFFGLTHRSDDEERLLLGQSVLKIHHADDCKCCPYGYFGTFEGDDFAIPSSGDGILQFVDDFGLSRSDEHGFSVVVPFPRGGEAGINAERLKCSALQQFFYPIIGGELTVEIAADGDLCVLSSATIDAELETVTGDLGGRSLESMRRLFELSRWAFDLTDDNHIDLPDPGNLLAAAPNWSHIALPEEHREMLEQGFEAGERLAIRVPIKVHRKESGAEPVRSSFTVYMQRDDDAAHNEEFFIRRGITISDARSYIDSGVRGLMIIEDKHLSSLLGDAENPAHTDWQQRLPRFSAQYVHGPSCVGFVKKSLHELIRKLSPAPETREIDLLRDLFYVEKDDITVPPTPTPGPGKKPGEDGTEIIEPIPAGPPPMIQITKLAGGFRVSPHPKAETPPVSINVRVAYERRRGSAFKHYDPLDFRLDQPPINVHGTGLAEPPESCDKNYLEFLVKEPDFELVVNGFDPERDLAVKAAAERPKE
jgi:hypothetical protein